MPRIFLSSLFLLAACATPLQQCLNAATQDLRVVDELIATTQGNLERGYAIKRELEPTFELRYCASPTNNFYFCNVPTTRVVETPAAIDLDAERRKLVSLQKQRQVLAERAAQQVETCNTTYPQS